jgi:hypothetical protein
MFNRVSADGYFAGTDGNLDWVVPDDEVDEAGAAEVPLFQDSLYRRASRYPAVNVPTIAPP